jgi:outer membrane protein
MKNLSLILNVVLLVAVAVLFYLHFAGPGEHKATEAAGASGGVIDAKIAFINADSVLKNYEYLKAGKKQLEEKGQKLDQEYRNRAMGLQGEIQNYQRTVNNLTLSQAKALEEDLGRKQQNLKMYEQTLTQQLMEEEQKLNKELYDRVTAFLKSYGQEKGLDVVLKFDPTSDLLFAGEALDITSDVITGLNEAYKNEGTVPAKTDSTTAK